MYKFTSSLQCSYKIELLRLFLKKLVSSNQCMFSHLVLFDYVGISDDQCQLLEN